MKRPAELRSTFLRRIRDEVDRSERLLQDGDAAAANGGRTPTRVRSTLTLLSRSTLTGVMPLL